MINQGIVTDIQISNMTSKGKTVEDYRRDIFSLKQKIKTEQQYLQELRQKNSDVDIFAEESYTFKMKTKILEYNLQDIKAKVDRYSRETAAPYYEFNFCVLALLKACQIMGISPEMVFRAVDIESKGVADWFNFANFLKQTLRLDASLANPIMKVLDPTNSTQILLTRYTKLLKCLMIDQEKSDKEIPYLQQSTQNICRLIIEFKVEPSTIWKTDTLNIATTINGLMMKLKNADMLDCAAVYCKSDPKKQGVTETRLIVNMLQHGIGDLGNFKQGDTFKIRKNR